MNRAGPFARTELSHEGAIVVTGSSIRCVGRVVAFFGAQLLEVVKSGFLLLGQMANVTFQPRLSIGSFRGRRAHEAIHVLGSFHSGCAAQDADEATTLALFRYSISSSLRPSSQGGSSTYSKRWQLGFGAHPNAGNQITDGMGNIPARVIHQR